MSADEDQIGSALENEPDEALVRASLGGDERAFARLVRRYLRKSMAVALEYVGSREDAEDVVQDSFRRVFERLDQFDPERRFEPWFFTILRNLSRNAAKSGRLRSHEPLAVEHPADTAGPFEAAHRSELRRQIEAAVGQLPKMQRTCFRLCLVEGLSSGEAANATGLAESTVRVHVFKARQTLQQLLVQWRSEKGDA